MIDGKTGLIRATSMSWNRRGDDLREVSYIMDVNAFLSTASVANFFHDAYGYASWMRSAGEGRSYFSSTALITFTVRMVGSKQIALVSSLCSILWEGSERIFPTRRR